MSRRILESHALWLTIAAFAVYNANLRSITSYDTYPTRYVPVSLLLEGDLDLDEFAFIHVLPEEPGRGEGGAAPDAALPYYLQRARGHVMSSYPVMTGILALPVYVIPVLLGLAGEGAGAAGYSRIEVVATLLGKIAASAAVAISAGVMLATLRRITTRGAAMAIALLYAFATCSWSVSSQGLWQSSMSQPLLAVALYALVRAADRAAYLPLAGLALGLSVACRPPNLVYAAVLALFVARRFPRRIPAFAAPALLVAAFLLGYNLHYFGSPAGGYATVTGGGSDLRGASVFEAVPGLLVSPSRGIAVYSPFLVLAAAGLLLALRERRDPLLVHVAVASLLTFAVYAKYRWWFGSFCYGYRYLVDLLPGLCLLLTIPWQAMTARTWARRAFVALAAWSVIVQIVGAFFYPCGWYEHPVSVRDARARLWDWRDPEILRCICAGPVEPDGLRLLRELAGGSGRAPATPDVP